MQIQTQINTPPDSAPHFTHAENVARGMVRVLSTIEAPAPVTINTRGYHQAEALKAAQDVAIQFTAQAKKQAKRKCLGHLIASLSSSKEATV